MNFLFIHQNFPGQFKHLAPALARRGEFVEAMVVPDGVAGFAYRQRLYVLAPSGETMSLRNDERFTPRCW